MPIPLGFTPKTDYVDGSTDPANEVNAARLNEIGGALTTLADGAAPVTPGALMTRRNTTTASASSHNLTFDTVDQETADMVANAAAGTVTVATAGWYSVLAHARASAIATGYSAVYVTVNGVVSVRSNRLSASLLDIGVSGLVYAPAGGVVAASVVFGSSAGLVHEPSGDGCRLVVVKV